MQDEDWCTLFPEYWYTWKFERIYIGDICEDHDDIDDKRGGCDSTAFAKGLWERKVMFGLTIFCIASLVCWVVHPLKMIKRI